MNFGVRFNFIAVDYLVYTQEVIKNILESYPIPLLLGVIAVITAISHVIIWKSGFPGRWLSAAAEPARRPLSKRSLLGYGGCGGRMSHQSELAS